MVSPNSEKIRRMFELKAELLSEERMVSQSSEKIQRIFELKAELLHKTFTNEVENERNYIGWRFWHKTVSADHGNIKTIVANI